MGRTRKKKVEETHLFFSISSVKTTFSAKKRQKKVKKWLFTFLSNQPWINIIQNSIQNEETCFSRKCLKRSAVNNSTEESKTENQVENACKENQSLEPVTKKAFRRFMSKVSYNESLEKIEIKIQFHG